MANKKKPATRPISSFDELDAAGIGVGYRPMSFAEEPATVPPPAERSTMRAIGDMGLALGQGALGSFKSITDLAGADNAVSGGLDAASKFLGAQKSAQSQATMRESLARIQQAEESGSTLDEAKAYLGMLWDQPGEMIAQGVGSFATLGLGKVAQGLKLAQAAKAAGVSKDVFLASGAGKKAVEEAAKFGFRANIGVGAGQGVGAVKGSQYEQTYENAIKSGMSEEYARELAAKAQEYGGEGTMQQLLGGALGAVASATGPIERTLLGAGKKPAQSGVMASVAKGFGKEFTTEGAQGAQERFAGNDAAVDSGVLAPEQRMRGVVGQGLMEGTIGGILGGLTGPFEGQAEAEAPAIDPAQEAADAIRSTEKLPESGPMTRAANAQVEAKAQAVEAGAPIADEQAIAEPDAMDDPVRDQILALPDGARQDALRAYAVISRPDVAKGVQQYNRKLLDRLLSENAPNVSASVESVTPEPATIEDVTPSALPEDALPSPQGMTDAQLGERLAFVQTQAKVNGWDSRLVQARNEIEAEIAARQEAGAAGQAAAIIPQQPTNFTGTPSATMGQAGQTVRPGPGFGTGDVLASVQPKAQPVAERSAESAEPVAEPAIAPTDILNPSGQPFKTKMAADRAAKKTPGAVIPVDGGFVVRPQEQAVVQNPAQTEAGATGTQAVSQPTQTPQAVGAQPAGPAAGVPAAGSAAVEAAGVEAAPEFTTVKTVFGESATVRTADLNGDKPLLRQYTKDGKPKGTAKIHRDNLDPTGEKQAAANTEDASNPMFDVVTRKGGEPFASKIAAAREQKRRGLTDSHEVVEASVVSPNASGFVVMRKVAAQEADPEQASVRSTNGEWQPAVRQGGRNMQPIEGAPRFSTAGAAARWGQLEQLKSRSGSDAAALTQQQDAIEGRVANRPPAQAQQAPSATESVASAPVEAPSVSENDKPELAPRSISSSWVDALGNWETLGEDGAKNHPGFASEKSARIAISKNPEWKNRSATVLPFEYNDGSYGTAYSDTRTRYVVVARKSEAAPEAKPVAEPAQQAQAATENVAQEQGPFGPIFDGFKNNPEGAIAKLMQEKRGEVADAFVHPELGPIAFVYGDENMGLRHIAQRRGDAWVARIPEILRTSEMVKDANGLPRAYLVHRSSDPASVAVIRLDWDGREKAWLVTAYPDDFGKFAEKKNPDNNQKRTGGAVDKVSGFSDQSGQIDSAIAANSAQSTQAIFEGLAARGGKKKSAQDAAKAHPKSALIAQVQDNYHDILISLMDSGRLEVNGSKTVNEDNKSCL